MNPQCALGGLCCQDVVARLWFCFPSGVCLPGLVHSVPITSCLSLFAFLCVKKCHIKASGAGNIPGHSPCWPGNSNEEHRVVLDEHSLCPHIPLLLPMSHPPSHLLSSSLLSPNQSKNRIGRLNQPRQLCQTDESEPPCCYTLHPSMSRDTKDWITPGNTVWSEFYLGFGSGSDVALAKPLRVQRESPSASSWILFWLQLSGFSREGWCWRLLSCPGSVRREGNSPNPCQAPVLP